ncbi:MAG: hypothetical protein Kow0042_19820 [Calditrichia bacterium]
MCLFFAAVLVFSGCARISGKTVRNDSAPIKLVLEKGVQWAENKKGFDRELPGFHLVGGIGEVTLRLTSPDRPPKLILEIQTSAAEPPMLEQFRIITSNLIYEMSPFSQPAVIYVLERHPGEHPMVRDTLPQDEYFSFKMIDGGVQVIFSAKSWNLLSDKCRISWVDRFRK